MKNIVLILIALLFFSCENLDSVDYVEPENIDSFNQYWYDGQAEISSFELNQARYGEVRKGNAVMIFVTEPFSKKYQTKADQDNEKNITVLKLNFTKNFVTGIYPYSIMTSVFYPVDESKNAIKLSCSIQEWCGQVYMEMNRNKNFNFSIHSYFQGESQVEMSQPITLLEDEIWTMIRVRPNELPMGEQEMIPGFSYLRLAHQELEPYTCECTIENKGDTSFYTISYTEIDRQLEIHFETEFPHKILGWKEKYPCGSCKEEEPLESTGELFETIKIDYWNKNSSADTVSRFKLGLH